MVVDGGLCCGGGDVDDMVAILKLVVRLPEKRRRYLK